MSFNVNIFTHILYIYTYISVSRCPPKLYLGDPQTHLELVEFLKRNFGVPLRYIQAAWLSKVKPMEA